MKNVCILFCHSAENIIIMMAYSSVV